MADGEIFGDPSLFGEFERDRTNNGSSNYDQHEDSSLLNSRESFDPSEPPPEFFIGSSDDSEADTSGFQKKVIENENIDSSEYQTLKTEIIALKQKITVLESQNQKLMKIARLLEIPKSLDLTEDSPAITLCFLNNRLARKYKSRIEGFISQLILEDEADEKLPALNIRSHYLCLADESSLKDCDENKLDDVTKACATIGSCQFYSSFISDSLGWPLVGDNPSLTDSWEIPSYEQIYLNSLPYTEDSEEEQPKRKRDKGPVCFNCGGGHTMRECTEKRDPVRIQQNRQEFMDKFSPATLSGRSGRDPRYHGNDTKFEKFKPGVISDDLRKALSLRDDELPPFIYQMRIYGYPPGHLQAAEISHSSFTMFDKHGRETNKEGEALEDGEVDSDRYGELAFDFNAIIEYPGFNAAVPDGYVDDSSQINMPPLMEHQLKSNLKEVMGESMFKTIAKPSRKRKANEINDRDEQDMDVDDSDGECHADISSTIQVGINGVSDGFPPLPPEPPHRGIFSLPPLPEEPPPLPCQVESLMLPPLSEHRPPLPPDLPHPGNLLPPLPEEPPLPPQRENSLPPLPQDPPPLPPEDFMPPLPEYPLPLPPEIPHPGIVLPPLPEVPPSLPCQGERLLPPLPVDPRPFSHKVDPALPPLPEEPPPISEFLSSIPLPPETATKLLPFPSLSARSDLCPTSHSMTSSIRRSVLNSEQSIPYCQSSQATITISLNNTTPIGEPIDAKRPMHKQVTRIVDSSSASTSPGSTPNRTQSFTLDELEQQKLQLLSQLAGEDTSAAETEQSVDEDIIQSGASTPTRVKSQDVPAISPFETPGSLSRNESIGLEFGTPVIEECNQSIKLPSPDKWSKDITEHIPYENLPNATGMFKKMRFVIKNVRKQTQQSQNK